MLPMCCFEPDSRPSLYFAPHTRGSIAESFINGLTESKLLIKMEQLLCDALPYIRDHNKDSYTWPTIRQLTTGSLEWQISM